MGRLFNKVNAQASFAQISQDNAKSKDLQSVTGKSFGTGKYLQLNQDDKNVATKVAQDPKKFIAKPSEKPQEQIDNVILPSGRTPPPPP